MTYNSTGFSILTFLFSDERDRYIGYGEGMTGFGLMIGPVIGGLLFVYIGYADTFYVFSAFTAFSFVMTAIFMPNSLNQKFKEVDPRKDQSLLHSKNSVRKS